jgi:hypothetical protein
MFRNCLFFGLILLSFVGLTSTTHKFYVSLTQIDVNKDTHKLEISTRIFTDDLQAAVFEISGKKLGLGTDNVLPGADSLLFAYLNSTMNFRQDGKNLVINFIGKEVEADVTWIYLETKEGILLKMPIEITNSTLQERFPDQKNLVNLKYGKETSSQIHTKEHPTYAFHVTGDK